MVEENKKGDLSKFLLGPYGVGPLIVDPLLLRDNEEHANLTKEKEEGKREEKGGGIERRKGRWDKREEKGGGKMGGKRN